MPYGCRWALTRSLRIYGREYEERLPDRITISKGKKCQERCVLARTTGEYICREYRC